MHVEQGHVELTAAQQLRGGPDTPGDADFVAGLAEGRRDQLTQRLVVIDDQNPNGSAGLRVHITNCSPLITHCDRDSLPISGNHTC